MAKQRTVEREPMGHNLLILAAQNANALTFVLGFGIAYAGVSAQWSSALANVAAGVVLMAIGASPYLRSRAS